LFRPAIALAREGFQVTERGREFLVNAKDRAAADPYGLAMFYDASGQPVPVGTTVKNPALAATLERIARVGPDAFYTADLAAHIAQATPKPGMATADLAAYQAKLRPP